MQSVRYSGLERFVPNEQTAYQSGFGNGFESEGVARRASARPQFSRRSARRILCRAAPGSPFTAPRVTNERSWLYRIRPTVKHWGRFEEGGFRPIGGRPLAIPSQCRLSIAPLRWSPVPIPTGVPDVPAGLRTITTAGDAETRWPAWVPTPVPDHQIHGRRVFLQRRRRDAVRAGEGPPRLRTEFGVIDIGRARSLSFRVGSRFRVELIRTTAARGYICENYGGSSACPSSARSAPTASRTSAISLPGRGLRGPRGRARYRQVGRHLWRPRSTTRRSMLSPGTATTRPTSTTSPFSPVGPISSTIPIRRSSRCSRRPRSARHRQHRLCDLPAIAGWWPRTPSARPGTTAT